jgi:hypothetical protein
MPAVEGAGGAGIGEERLQRALEEEADDPGGNRADHDEQRQPFVGVLDPAAHRGAQEPADDPHPLLPVEEEQRRRRPQVEQHQEGHEALLRGPEVEVEEAGHHHRVAERGDGKELGRPLEERDEAGEPGGHSGRP